MRTFFFAAAALLTSATALAEPNAGARVSVGVGAITGFRVEGPNESGDGGLGLYLRLGAQINDLFGVENDVSGVVGIIPMAGISAIVRESIDFTVTPIDWLTIATGPTYSWGADESASVIGGTLRVDFHFPRRRLEAEARRAWTLGVGGDVGAVIERAGSGRGLGWGAFLTFGYAWY